MSPDQAHLARKNLDRRLAPLRAEPLIAPPSGWIKAIREALGMTAEQLARRMGVVQSRVSTLEKAERTGTPSLKTLREAAEAMNCTLVYAIVPTSTLDDIIRDQAARRPALNSRAITIPCALKIRRWISEILPPSASDWFPTCLRVHFAACGMKNERSSF